MSSYILLNLAIHHLVFFTYDQDMMIMEIQQGKKEMISSNVIVLSQFQSSEPTVIVYIIVHDSNERKLLAILSPVFHSLFRPFS